ncbi:MAG TPA: glycosyltransferase [Opitutaceae bacterium]|nr:glycosyltransferase [Opitutaceae bacterium]
MTPPLLLDLSHTSHTRARTGIQRVARALHDALGAQALAITHDPHRDLWRPLEPWEQANLAANSAEAKRSAQWPLDVKLRARAQRWLGNGADGSGAALPPSAGLLVPEVFSSGVAAALPALFAATTGPRVAVFHDAIALKFPEITPAKTVARFPAYLCELLRFDGIAANSEDSRDSLVDYWKWLGIADPPPVCAIPLGVDPPALQKNPPAPASALPIVLSIGSIEGRKNHLALLEACEELWQRGLRFELRLIGLANAQTGRAAVERIHALQAAGRSLIYSGPLDDPAVKIAYAECAFTVYPSLIEGFGLPVIESLAHGKPCVCSARGALGESARGGGCVPLDRVDAGALAATIGRLLESPAELAALEKSARSRKFKTWSDYAREIVDWIRILPRRGS